MKLPTKTIITLVKLSEIRCNGISPLYIIIK